MTSVDLALDPATGLPIRTRGRAAPDYPTYTFKDSGQTCRLRRLSPITTQRIQEAIVREWKKLPADDDRAMPQPPTERIAVGGGPEREEANPNDPAYKERLAAWERRVQGEMIERLIRVAALDACIFEPGVIDTDWTERFERRMNAEGQPLNIPDHYQGDERAQIIWVIYHCLGSQEDLTEFVQHLSRRSEIRQEDVATNIATFQTA